MIRTVLVNTDPSGAFSYERPFKGQIRAIEIVVGSLGEVDIAVTDGTYGIPVLSVTGAISGVYLPVAPSTDEAGLLQAGDIVMGTLRIDVSNGGDTKHGAIHLLI